MITYTCDAAGCGATSPSQLPEIAGLHVCPRCARGLKAHIIDWLADTAIQAQVRSDQGKIDAANLKKQEDEEKAKEEGLEGQIANRVAQKLKLPLDSVLERMRKIRSETGVSVLQASRDLLQEIANERTAAARDASPTPKQIAKAEAKPEKAAAE